MKNRKVLVTGANGFLARTTIKELGKKGAKIIATSIEDKPMYELPQGAEYAKANLTDRKSINALFNKHKGIEDIIHHAALFSLSATEDALMKVNAEGTGNLLVTASHYNAERAIITSSGTVYKSGKRSVKEGDELGPCEIYGKSKLKQEELTRLVMGLKTNTERMRCGIVRPAVIMGPESRYGGQTALFTHYLLGSLLQGMSAVPGDGNTELCFVHVEDCARLHIHMLEKDLVSTDCNTYPEYVFNSVDCTPITNNELADLVIEETKLPKYRRLLQGKKITLPEKPLKILSKGNDKLMNWLKERGYPLPTVSLDSGSVELMFAGNVSMSPKKSIDAGFMHNYPDSRIWLRHIVQQNIKTNWKGLLGKFSFISKIL